MAWLAAIVEYAILEYWNLYEGPFGDWWVSEPLSCYIKGGARLQVNVTGEQQCG